MAHPLADLKFGFFPTPNPMVEAFKKLFVPAKDALVADLCGGEGEMLQIFADGTGMVPLYNDLDRGRFAKALSKFEYAIRGDFFTVQLEKDSVSVMLLNPPYSLDHTQKGTDNVKREGQFIRRVFKRQWIQKGGYLVLVLYKQHITSDLFRFLAQRCESIDVWGWDEIMLQRFQHVAIIAKVGNPRTDWQDYAERVCAEAKADNYPMLDGSIENIYHVPAPNFAPTEITFRHMERDRNAVLREIVRSGADLSNSFQVAARPPIQLTGIRPVLDPKLAHMLTMIQSGVIDNVFLEMESGELAVLRSIVRYVQREEEQPDADDVASAKSKKNDKKKSVIRKTIQADLYLTKEDGEVEHLSDTETVRDFMVKYSAQLFDLVKRNYTPYFDVGGDPATYAPMKKWMPYIDSLRVRGKHDLFPTQKIAINAALHMLWGEGRRGIYLCLEPSMGKTAISIAIAGSTIAATIDASVKAGHAKQGEVFGVIAPGGLIEKWEREIKEMLPHANVLKLVLTDVDGERHDMLAEFAAWMRAAKQAPLGSVNIFVASQDAIKLGEGDKPAIMQNAHDKRKNLFRDPVIGKLIADPKDWKDRREFLSGNELIGWETTEDMNGNDMRQRAYRNLPERYHAVWGECRLYRKPKKGNGRVELVDVKAPTRSVVGTRIKRETARHELTAGWRVRRERNAVVGQELRNLTGEPILDPWLAQQGTRPTMNPRAPLWRVLLRHFKGQINTLFIDEVHNSATVDSDIFASVSHVALAARKIVALTGTIYRGYASSVFGLESIVNPERLFKHYGWGEVGIAQWIHDMGVLQEVVEDADNVRRGRFSGVKRRTLETKELPGASPLLVKWLLDHAIFLSLKDLGKVLPPYEETPSKVDLAPEQFDALLELNNLLERYDKMVGRLKSFTYNYQFVNNPFKDLEVWGREKEFDPNGDFIGWKKVLCGIVPGIDESVILPKEQAMLDLVHQNTHRKNKDPHGRAGIGTVIFVQHTGKRDLRGRLKNLIEQHVPEARPFILDQKIPAIEREGYIARQVAKGSTVMICNPRLVKEGFDLLDFPDYWWHELSTELVTTIQASRRGWRIPQHNDCRVFFPVSKGTVEAPLMKVITMKLRTHAVIAGDEVALDANGDGGSVLSEVIKTLDDVTAYDLSAAFKQLNAKYAEQVRDAAPAPNPQVVPAPVVQQPPAPKKTGLAAQVASISFALEKKKGKDGNEYTQLKMWD